MQQVCLSKQKKQTEIGSDGYDEEAEEGIDSDHYENFPILYDSQIPSILLELGYLSNSEDYTKLTDETFQQKIANAITESFLDQIN